MSDLTTSINEKSLDATNVRERLRALLAELDLIASRDPALKGQVAISFVSPCYNEEQNLEALYKAICDSCKVAGVENFEIVWVENGSRDQSLEVMRRLAAADSRLRVISLARNFGYQGGIACGLDHARGEWIGILDADLQDHPSHLLAMWKMAREENLDVVYGVRTNRKEGWFLKICYKLFYRIWRATAEMQIPVDAGDFSVIHRSVVAALQAMPERQRFLRGLRAWVGFRQKGYRYERMARQGGVSKFNYRGMVLLALDGLLSYSVFPLRLVSLTGFGLVCLTSLLLVTQGLLRLIQMLGFDMPPPVLPPGLTQLSLLITGLSGLIIFLLGIIGEYLGRIYEEVKGRPIYVVREYFYYQP
jgi:dolichol-phosphate mannosyltransferase